MKRTLDVAASCLLLVLTSPVLLLTALIIRLEGTGPIFYWQQRVGYHGLPFNICKFRTMQTDAERVGMPQMAGHADVRVTRIGRFLRRFRIDELPQVLNVLKGEMSLVGPRPERPHFVDLFANEIPFYHVRHQVKPGITGWAQINYPYGANLEDAKAKLVYDLDYVENSGILLDLLIMLRTPKAIFIDQGGR